MDRDKHGARGRAPWHLWLVGLLGLAWNGFGANDYLQTQLGNVDYIASMTEGMNIDPAAALAFFQSMPAWADALWALGVWGSVLGSVLLLMRSRHAVTAFIVSLAGLAGSTLYQQTMEMPEWLAGQPHLIMSLVIWAALLAQFAYAWVMRRRGLLR